MNKKSTFIAVLVVLVVLLFASNSNASPKNKIEYYDFYALKDTPCYLAQYDGQKWLVVFDKQLKPFKRNEYISSSWVGEQTYISPNGLRTTFYFLEIEVGGAVFTVAVLSNDVTKILV